MANQDTVIAVANQKGGAGKSTMAANLAAAWGKLGRRTLAIDLDPQFNLTEMFGTDPEEAGATLAEVFIDEGTDVGGVAVAEVVPGVDLVSGSLRLADVEKSLATENFREEFLAQALQDHIAGYSRVLLDCPPNLGDLTVNALYAADHVVIPINMSDRNAFKGAHDLIRTITVIQRKRPELQVLAVVRNEVDRRLRLYKALNKELETTSLPVARTEIVNRAGFQNTGAEGVPLVIDDSNSDGGAGYIELARELDKLLAARAANTDKAAA
jgi:chromosome partitioning protein